MSSTFSPESIPNRFDFAETQSRIYAQWEASRAFHAEPPTGKDPSKGPYSIVIPPPNVTGALHLGHALNNTLQDAQIRMHRMMGYNTLWMPGTDHAGIATQAVVEKRIREEEKLSRHDLGRDELVRRIWEWKDKSEKRILSQLKGMGCSCDWERVRFTLDDQCAAAVRQTFFNLFKDGKIYRGKRLVNWDTFLQTAVSDDEVFQETVKGKFYHFRYEVIGPQQGEPKFVTIATTRPETMLGDTAVAVHPDPARAVDKAEAELRERLAKAPAKEQEGIQAQIDNIVTRRQELLPQLITLRDMAKAGRKLMLPLVNREIPLVADEWAKPELGTGCVKITPAHDPNDYLVGQRQKLPMINILKPDGTLNSEAGPYQGLTIQKARMKVVADLDELGLLGDVDDREIELPHSDRSKTPIEPYLADQWFVKMDQLAQSAMDAVTDGRVKIFPERYAKSYLDWLGEKRDWPVSRQLWWGHRIPVWTKQYDQLDAQTTEFATDKDSKASPLKSNLLFLSAEENAKVRIQQSTDVSTGERYRHVSVMPGEHLIESKLVEKGFVQDPDVLDTWFSSALWPHSTLGWPQQTKELEYYYPTSTLITSRDIITLWVARMVLTGLSNVGEIPFHEVFIHPKILDGYGETMSKSKGNGVDPLDVIEKFGADSLRFGLAQLTTETQDVRMPVQFECPHCQSLVDQTLKNRILPRVACTKCSKEFSTQWANRPEDIALPRAPVVSERFEVARNFMNKLWNAARFSLMNLNGYEEGSRLKPELQLGELAMEDRWLISRLATVTGEVTSALQTYKYADATKALYDFAWDDFCSFYVEITKARLQDPVAKPICQRVLAHTLDVLLRLLHPLMPFVTEEIWQNLGKIAPVRGLDKPEQAAAMCITAPWPEMNKAHQDPTTEARFATFQAALGALREIRSRQNIAMKSPIEFSVTCSAETAALLTPMLPYLQSMANAKPIEMGPQATAPANHSKAALPGMDIYVDLKDFIDVQAEIAKNQQLEQKLLGIIKGKEAKLSNESFVARAPANVVQVEREALEAAQTQLAAVKQTLEALAKMK
ncbi:Valine--tRNA ligase [Anatilimnocola aggregata]|uniref:Valine--tRNA ligase n=1 Tax=Anatilimnocola aggregata TaxID=2528021 RepID=A0A517Y7I4_9BACT|nr:valine--tRNA ligase [Anatilimnocola aggregata]QDU26102.1 Valine--tRNA ligase [Anatilimnocola aggregata]